jgi:D-serine dehydratase
MMESSWKPSQQIGSSPTDLDYNKVSCYSCGRHNRTYHDGRQQSSPCPGLDRVLDRLVGGALTVSGCHLRVRSHAVSCAICSAAIDLL